MIIESGYRRTTGNDTFNGDRWKKSKKFLSVLRAAWRKKKGLISVNF